ncbi:MAG: hypothetical protein F6K22_35235, partial [Okeania sp. SIO2F4]|uniref:archaeosortase/exosortase family protein n=1 Tax=Okeania sp. SIO2F4 TaxID=2607790 RepID=UPI00142C01DF
LPKDPNDGRNVIVEIRGAEGGDTLLVSVSANIVRNTVLTIFHGTGQDEAFHWLHDGWGGDMYSACMLGLLILIMNWVDNYFTTSADAQNQSDI